MEIEKEDIEEIGEAIEALGKMIEAEQQAWLKEYRDKLITPEDEALWKRGASNAGYHYLGCAKTMAQIGKAFAEAMVKMEKE